MRFLFLSFVLSSCIFAAPAEPKPILERKVRLDKKLDVICKDQTLEFNWLAQTKTCIIRVSRDANTEEWWMIFDRLPESVELPKNHELPMGLLSLEEDSQNLSGKGTLRIKMSLSRQFVF
ncbi:MAG: hypothetical protein Q8K36_06670, partial [Alphaproteobacteria bacterium]|nr:hypothetical protein [Alphaproteobacteria bacterium]